MKLVLTGGFLGSGKTTAIVAACRIAKSRGQHVAVITNDQGAELVDSRYVQSLGIVEKHVSNGCFCCNYNTLDERFNDLLAHKPDFIFAEPVGSCTDLVATVAEPLRRFRGIDTVVCVFIDAELFAAILEERAAFITDSVRYIFMKQIEEADFLVINKSDRVTTDQLQAMRAALHARFADKAVIVQNSLDEADVQTWLRHIDECVTPPVRTSIEVDYQIYGQGEAAFAWADRVIEINSVRANAVFAAAKIIGAIVDQVQVRRLPIGHLKFAIESEAGLEKVSFTTTSTASTVRLTLPDTNQVRMVVNARLLAEPSIVAGLLDAVIDAVASQLDCRITVVKGASFSPAFPRPTHRITSG